MEGLTRDERDKYFSRNVSDPRDIKQVLIFFDKCYKKDSPALLSRFHTQYSEIPDFTYKKGEKLWKHDHQNDIKAMRWFNEIRTQEAHFAAQVGKLFDRCFVADLFSVLKERNIPIFNQTTGIASFVISMPNSKHLL